jgi:2,4-dienoyl-CoA reductase-like NADH-dependent reductase (Old Yellow Enzyme family)
MSILFTSFNFNKLEIKNRFIFSACEDNLPTDLGLVTDEIIKKGRRVAAGEVGLIISSHIAVHPLGRGRKRQLGIYSDDMIPGLKDLTDAVHGQGSKIIFQLGHAGIQAMEKAIGQLPIGPSPSRRNNEMNEDQIQEVLLAFAKGASRSIEAGADGIQLHAAHGYLINEFLSPYFNHRSDLWGGSEENRFRFLGSIVTEIKKILPEGLPLLIKLNSNDYTPEQGITTGLAAAYAKRLAQIKIDGLEVSCGTTSQSPWNMCRGKVPAKEISKGFPEARRSYVEGVLGELDGKFELQEAYNLEATKMIRPVMGNVPLFAVGGFRQVACMEEAVENGGTDCISMCRPFIREPYLVKHIKEGKTKTASCLSCNKCLAALVNDIPVKCYHKGLPK